MTNTETFTLTTSSQPKRNTRGGPGDPATHCSAIFKVTGDQVQIFYYPYGTDGGYDNSFGVILEGLPGETKITPEPVSREIAKKVWNRFRELNFTRI